MRAFRGGAMPLLLVLGYVWPEPASSAAGWRMLSLLRMFRDANWQVVFASSAEPTPHQIDLAQEQITTARVALNCQSFATQLQQWQPTAVLFDRFMLEEQFGWWVDEYCPQALKLLDSEDLHCLRQARAKAFKAKRAVQDGDLTDELALREIAAVLRCDLTLTISQAELTLLKDFYKVPPTQLLYCPFLLPDHQLSPSEAPQPFATRQHLSFIGNFRHEPNWQTVLRLHAWWPTLRPLLPAGTELHIYGAYPPPKATALSSVKQGFIVKGWAQDAAVAFSDYRLLLAPLPFGAGLKGKLVEAAIHGCPTLTTTIGVEGLSQQAEYADFPGLVADEELAFCQAAAQLYQDTELWTVLQQRAQPWLGQFAESKLSGPLLTHIHDCLLHLASHRQQHFTGNMLKYHHHRSTRFMGQWIEAKNALAKVRAANEIAAPDASGEL